MFVVIALIGAILFVAGASADAAPRVTQVDCDTSGGAALQAAIEGAELGDTILVSGTCTNTPMLIPGRGNYASFRVPAGHDIRLLGVTDESTLDGLNDGIVLWIDNGATVELKGFVVTGGNGKYTLGDVGGINNEGNLLLKNSLVTGNVGQGYSTGGLANQGSGTLEVINSSISNNTTGAYGTAGAAISGLAVFRNSVVDGNVGGTGSNGAFSVFGELTLRNTIVSNNQAGYTGGVVVRPSGQFVVLNSRVVYNDGGWHGGVVNEGVTTMKDSVVEYNEPDNCVGFVATGCAE